MSSWQKNGQDLAQTSRKWRKKISNGESDGERKIYPSANPGQVMFKIATSKKKLDVPRSRECLPFWRLNMSLIRGTFSPSGDSMKKCHILGISDCLAHFTTKKRMLKQVGKTPVHQDLNLIRCIKEIHRCD